MRRENRESTIMVARRDWKIQRRLKRPRFYVGTAAPGCPSSEAQQLLRRNNADR
jgi:hypothetical protein